MTATDDQGVVHQLAPDGNTTLCGQKAAGWSRAVTKLQEMGLVLFCEECERSQ